MKKTIITILSVLLLFLASSCTCDIEDPLQEFKGESWGEIFEEFWTVMDEEYVHFSYEDTDWDGIYEEYAPLFSKLDIKNADDSFKAFGCFNRILLNFVDYHYKLTINTEIGYIYEARPSLLRKWVEKGYDVDEFPTVMRAIEGTMPVEYNYYSVKSGKDKVITKAERDKDYVNEIVDGYLEKSQLGDKFHSDSEITYLEEGGIEKFDVVGKNNNLYYSFALSPFGLSDTDWYYGVTESGVLYLHFSKFVSPGAIKGFYWFNNFDSLSEEEQEACLSKYRTSYKSFKKIIETTDSKLSEEKHNLTVMARFSTYLIDAINKGQVKLADGTSVDIKGIVIDLRGNGGGAALFYQELMGYFFASDKTVGYTQRRIGYSRYDMGPWVEYKLGTYNQNLTKDYQGRVAIITNGASVSCSELTTLTSKLIPSSKIFGSTTFGGTCALTDRNVMHSGEYTHQYSVSSSLDIRTTTFRFKAYDGTVYETSGVDPDVPVALSTERDNRFVSAVTWAATGTVPEL